MKKEKIRDKISDVADGTYAIMLLIGFAIVQLLCHEKH